MLRLFRNPSAGLIVAVIALFVALGSGVYAASKINGKQIKKGSIAGNKLKANGVTGQQVDESTLGKVPSAQNADSAQNAANAATLGGAGPESFVAAGDVQRLQSDINVGGDNTTAQTHQVGPLRLELVCNDVFEVAVLRATTSAQGAGIDIGYSLDDSSARTAGGGLGASPLELLALGTPPAFHRAVGNIVYNDPERTITIPFTVFFNSASGNTRCFFTGTATTATGPASGPSPVTK